MTDAIDRKAFWDAKIIGWEESRYGTTGPSVVEDIAGRMSSSVRYRMVAAAALLKPHLQGRLVVELGCGSGLLAETLVAAGAAGYRGFDISESAVERARQRMAASVFAEYISFEARPVSTLDPQGDALVLSLGLFDWLTPAEIERVFEIGRQGSYFHALAERRASLQQVVHRLYVHLAYGYRTDGYVPQYHTVAQIAEAARRHGLAEPNIHRDRRMRFGIFATDLPLTPNPRQVGSATALP